MKMRDMMNSGKKESCFILFGEFQETFFFECHFIRALVKFF